MDCGKASDPVTAATLTYPAIQVGVAYDGTPTVTTTPADASGYTVAGYAFSGNPMNMSINASTGEVTGTTSGAAGGSVAVTATVTNSDGSTVTATGTIAITAATETLQGEMTEAETPTVTKKGKK
ncbi:putative Ig domain-containing protein [Kluyvera georgiana]|uniref:putative Ig domain-containing protein n=1 Tax=Kluyvera georgiana TaxID=73098 RepID=UPI003AF181D8